MGLQNFVQRHLVMDHAAISHETYSPSFGKIPEPLAILPERLPAYALIVRVDRGLKQVVKGQGITRNTRWHGHTILTLIGPESRISVGFHPKTPPAIDSNIRQKIKDAWTTAKGKVCDEEERYHDSCCVFPLTPDQHQRAAHKIQEWRINPPLYQAVARIGENCNTFFLDVMNCIDIKPPAMWKKMVYPMAIDLLISLAAMQLALLPRQATTRDSVQYMSGQQTRQLFYRMTASSDAPHV